MLMSYAVDKPVIAVMGSKDSEKTLAVEILVQGLSSMGYRVATVKHVPKPSLAVDQKGTDTWRHTKAGAKVVLSISPNESAIIKQVDARRYDLTRMVMECGEDIDLVILEGFETLVGRDPRVIKIIAIKSISEALEASDRFSPILAYVGTISGLEVPQSFSYINLCQEKEKLVDLVHERMEILKKGLKPAVARISFDGKHIPCKRFVQEFIRKTVLAMVSTLKGVDVRGDEEVQIYVRSRQASHN